MPKLQTLAETYQWATKNKVTWPLKAGKQTKQETQPLQLPYHVSCHSGIYSCLCELCGRKNTHFWPSWIALTRNADKQTEINVCEFLSFVWLMSFKGHVYLSSVIERRKMTKRRQKLQISHSDAILALRYYGQHSLTSVERSSYPRSDFVNVWRHARLVVPPLTHVSFASIVHSDFSDDLMFVSRFYPAFRSSFDWFKQEDATASVWKGCFLMFRLDQAS